MSTELAQRAYHAYGAVTDFKNFRGDPMPAWDDLGDRIQAAWIAAAEAVATSVTPVRGLTSPAPERTTRPGRSGGTPQQEDDHANPQQGQDLRA